jgi:hypothetical protein
MLPVCKSYLLEFKHNGPGVHYFSPVSRTKVDNATGESGNLPIHIFVEER